MDHVKLIPRDTCRFLIAEIVLALEFLHSKNISHRNLKLENILLDEKYHIKISDFKYAKIINGKNKGEYIGTPYYVSPEMLNEKVSGLFTDLWSLGIIVYKMIVGEFPLKSNQQLSIFE